MRGLPGILASAAVALLAPADGANAATVQQTINRLNTQVSIDLRLSPVLRGRRATLTLTSLAISCRRGRCQWTPGRPLRRTIALARKPLRLSLPSPRRGIRLTLNTSA